MSNLLHPQSFALEQAPDTSREEPVSFPFKIAPRNPFQHSSSMEDHLFSMERALREALPKDLYTMPTKEFVASLKEKLPIVQKKNCSSSSDWHTIYLLADSAKEEECNTVFPKLISKCLLNEKKPNIISLKTLSFQWNLFPGMSFYFMEMQLLLEETNENSFCDDDIHTLSNELALCLKQPKLTPHILSHKNIAYEAKLDIVHKDLAALVAKFPKHFDTDLFKELGRFLSLTSTSFYTSRQPRLISKIVATHYILRAHIQRSINAFAEVRHLRIRFMKNSLTFHFGTKPVLSLIISVSILDRHDFLEAAHIELAAQTLIPGIKVVKGSFYEYQGPEDPVRCLYVELEKNNGSSISIEELTILKKEMEEELKRRIETLVPSIFMIRNEEETMRSILILSQELKCITDIPQVMISLDRQTSSDICFTVILVRLQTPGFLPMQKLFEIADPSISCIPDRIQQVGYLKKNTPKEANVFRLSLPKTSSLLRADFSVNFYLARQRVATLIQEAIGPFRDYNGGMILKQGELFCLFKEAFPSLSKKNHELLENFFFALNPIETQATLPLPSLTHLFSLFLEATQKELIKKDHYHLKIEERNQQLFTLIRTQETSFKQELMSAFSFGEFSHKSLIQTHVTFQGSLYSGFILQTTEVKKQTTFIEAIHAAIHRWKQKLKQEQTLKLSFTDLPRTFDPRLKGDQTTCTLCKMLFEGLTRIGKIGKPELALAESISVSSDLKKYTFRLKKCFWSNGDPITAFDFEYAWKKTISPQFATAFSYFFHPIKNAKKAINSLCDIDDVGISTLDAATLEVELEHPTPEFLELTAHSLYSPVHHILDQHNPNWGAPEEEKFLCNGPFLIKKTYPGLKATFAKNPLYWDKDNVRLEQIHISKDNSYTANEMFKNDETDWLGKPLRAWEPFFTRSDEDLLSTTPMGILWNVFNTSSFPFNNLKLRQALSYAIDREHLVQSICYDALAASTPLPLAHTMNHDPREASGNKTKALILFEEALEELGLCRKTFPNFPLIFSSSGIRESCALYLAQEWNQLFNINCIVTGYEFHTCLNKMMKGEFQCGIVFWQSLIDNPLYTLNAFKEPSEEINFAKWSNPSYAEFLEKAQNETDPLMRVKYLAEAERILIKEKPVLPIFYEKERNIKKHHLKNVIYSASTGYVDFKYAYIER